MDSASPAKVRHRLVALALAALAMLSVLIAVALIRTPGRPAAPAITRAPCTVGPAPPARRMMRRARSASLPACGGEGTLAGTATITGVGFFDPPHATGAAANGIELHPVLGFTSRNCA